MIRLIQRRLIVPRGDTGTFSIPMLAGKDGGDAAVFTVFDPLTHRKIAEKVMTISNGTLTIDFTHGDTVNLPVGQYVWDIKFYNNPVIVDEKIVDGEEIDSYYAAFNLPVCEIRETGDDLLMDDNAPAAKLAPGQVDYITAAITEIQAAKEAAVNSAAEADTSATNAENSASAAAMSASAALDSQTAATASQQGAAVSESHAAASASSAATSATTAGESADSAVSSATSAAQSALAAQDAQTAAESASSNATAQATNALASAQAAANSANSATNSQQAAANSATSASQSAGAAQVSETNASASATQAGHSATTAQEAAARAIATAVAIHEEIPIQVSQLENDAGYLTEHQDISGKANSADLATVATSGSYNDLSNKPFIPSAISDLTDDSGHYTKPANGIPATDMTSGVQTSLGLADTAYQKPANGIPANDLASGVIPSVPVQDVQIKNTSILNNGVANIPLAANGAVGLVQGNNTYGTAITAAGDIMIYRADDSAIKNGNGEYKPIVPYTEHQAVFYGLAKAAGDTTQRESQNNVGIYTSGAKSAIQAMLDVPSTSSVASSIASAVGNVHSFDIQVVQTLPSQDIQEHTVYFVPKTGETNDVYDEYIYVNNAWEMIGNTQIDLSNYVQKTDYATTDTAGIVQFSSTSGFVIGLNGKVFLSPAGPSEIKEHNITYKSITPKMQNQSVFYGLAEAAGDTTQALSENAVGTYTAGAKTAIQTMLDVPSKSDLENLISISNNAPQEGDAKIWIDTDDSSTVQVPTVTEMEAALAGKANVGDIPTVPVQDVQINSTSVLNNGVANIPIGGNTGGSSTALGVVRGNAASGVIIDDSTGEIMLSPANSNAIKAGTHNFKPISIAKQHEATFYGLSKAAGVDLANETVTLGRYPGTARIAIRKMIDALGTNNISAGFNLDIDAETENWILSTNVQDVQINGTSIVNNGIANIPIASSNNLGVIKVNESYGIIINPFTGELTTYGATSNQIKSGNEVYRPVSVIRQHEAVFYGLAKAAGDTTQAQSENAVGTYTETAKVAIRSMLGATSSNIIAVQDEQPTDTDTKVWLPETQVAGIEVPTMVDMNTALAGKVSDVQINGSSVVSNNVANIPLATQKNLGISRPNMYGGITVNDAGQLNILGATIEEIKSGTNQYKPITAANNYTAIFYGLAKAAGDATQSASSNAIGTYTTEAKAAIHTMLGIDPASIAAQVDIPLVETVSGTTPTITGQPNVRYVCGEVSTITITPPTSGSVDVIFESGSTATTMTVPSTVKWPAWFDAEALEANTTYEVLITDGIYGSVMTWAT